MKFVEMPKELQTKSIETLSLNYGMPEQIIEKDWWVSAVMRALFALPYANQISFKGGTSLSKCWNVISRFSEDIDIAVNRVSRHLYDIAMMMKTDIANRALADKQLFENIVEHRRKFIGLKGFDYSTLCAEKICIVPLDYGKSRLGVLRKVQLAQFRQPS